MWSKPNALTVRPTHFSSPRGRPLSMLTWIRPDSFAVNAELMRAFQFAGHSTGQGDNSALIASSA